MNRGVWILTAGSLVVSGCLKTDPDPAPLLQEKAGVVHLTIRPRWWGSPFDKTVVYTNVLAQRVLVQQLRFFLADMRMTSAGEEVLMKDADLFDLTNGSEERWYRIAPGGYDQLRFGIGLPYALNHSDPSNYPVNDPLGANSGMDWGWVSLHRFMLFEGRFDTLPGSGIPPFQFSVHTGFDTCYRESQVPVAMDIAIDDTVELVLDMDLSRFFHNATDSFDLSEGSQWHGEAGQVNIALKLSDMVAGSFSMP